MWTAIEKVGKAKGRDVFELLALAASERTNRTANILTGQAITAMKIIKDILVAGESSSQQDITITKDAGPAIYLPKEMPANVTPIDGKAS